MLLCETVFNGIELNGAIFPLNITISKSEIVKMELLFESKITQLLNTSMLNIWLTSAGLRLLCKA